MLHKAMCNELVPVYLKLSSLKMCHVSCLAYWNSILHLQKFIEVMKVRDESLSTAKWKDEDI